MPVRATNGYPASAYRGPARPRPSRVPTRRATPRPSPVRPRRPPRPGPLAPRRPAFGPRPAAPPFGRRPPYALPVSVPTTGPLAGLARTATRVVPLVGWLLTAAAVWDVVNSGVLVKGAYNLVCSKPHTALFTFWEHGIGLANPVVCPLTAQAIGGENLFPSYTAVDAHKILWAVYLPSPLIGFKKASLEVWDRNGHANPEANQAPNLPEHVMRSALARMPALFPEAAAFPNLIDAFPIAPPFWAVPNLRPLPLSPQTREAGYGPIVGPVPSPAWSFEAQVNIPGASRVNRAPNTNPRARPGRARDVRFRARAPGITKDVFARAAPRKPRERERKQQGSEKVRAALGNALAGFSEANDFVDVLFKALPKHVQRAANRSSDPGPWKRARAVVQHFDEIDIDLAIQNFIENEIEDRAVGRAMGGARKGAQAIDPSGSLWGNVQWLN